jgi:hypothetical protein
MTTLNPRRDRGDGPERHGPRSEWPIPPTPHRGHQSG